MVQQTEAIKPAAGDRPAGPLRKLFGYRLTSRAYFHLPVFFVYMYLHGQRVDTIEGLLALYGLAILVSGPFVARFNLAYGPVRALATGELAKCAGLIALAFSPGIVWGLVIGQLLSGAGYALTSSVEASVVGMLEPDRTQVARIQSSTQSWIFVVVLVSGVSGAIIFSHTQITVFLLSAAACLAAVLQLAGLRLPEVPGSPARPEAAQGTPAKPAKRARSLIASVWPWVTYYAAIRSVALACFVGFIPYLLFVRAHVSLAFFGLMLALFNLAAFAVARWNRRLVDALGIRGLLCGTLACLAVSLGLLAAFHAAYTIGVAIALLGAAAGAVRPITQAGLSAVPPATRGPLNARMEQVTGACNAAILAIGGLLLEYRKETILMAVATVLVVVCGLILLLRMQRQSANPASETPGGANG